MKPLTVRPRPWGSLFFIGVGIFVVGLIVFSSATVPRDKIFGVGFAVILSLVLAVAFYRTKIMLNSDKLTLPIGRFGFLVSPVDIRLSDIQYVQLSSIRELAVQCQAEKRDIHPYILPQRPIQFGIALNVAPGLGVATSDNAAYIVSVGGFSKSQLQTLTQALRAAGLDMRDNYHLAH